MIRIASLALAVALVASVALAPPPARAGDLTVAPKAFDLTQGWTIPAAGDTGTSLTESPTDGAITLAATAGLRTACVYTRIIDLTAPLASRPETFSGPAKGTGAIDIAASTASGTVTITAVPLYGVDKSNVTTVNDLSSTSASGTFTFTGTGQTDTAAIRMFTNHVARPARFMRFLLKNTSGVAATIPAHKLNYLSP